MNIKFSQIILGDKIMMLDDEIWDNNKQFDYLFECARKKGLTTAVAIAEESGVDANTISRLKTGRQKSPDLIQVVRLYKACGASLDHGFGIENDETSEFEQELTRLRYENERLTTELEAKEQLITANEDSLKSTRRVALQRSHLITTQAIIITILVLAIVGVLIYDKLNPDIGWFRDTLEHIVGGMETNLPSFFDTI